jgi:hypothetical protein
MAKITLPAAPAPLKIVKVLPPRSAAGIGKSQGGQPGATTPETGAGTLPHILFPAGRTPSPFTSPR